MRKIDVGILVSVVLIFNVLLSIFLNPGDFANGQNYYCPDRNSTFEIQATTPIVTGTFTCKDEKKPFKVEFNGPKEPRLISIMLEKREPIGGPGILASKGIGIILADSNIIQIYEVQTTKVYTHWRAANY